MFLNKRDVKKLVSLSTKIDKEKAVIAKARDNLRELISEVEEIIDDADNLVDTMERAVDDMSKYL